MRNRLREARKVLKMNQREFGKHLGLTQTHISMVEGGNSSITEKNIKLICSTFNISERWLKTGKGSMFCASPHEKEFQEIFSVLTPDTQKALLIIARELLNVQEKLLKESDTTTE